jgi:hypothetical protein
MLRLFMTPSPTVLAAQAQLTQWSWGLKCTPSLLVFRKGKLILMSWSKAQAATTGLIGVITPWLA